MNIRRKCIKLVPMSSSKQKRGTLANSYTIFVQQAFKTMKLHILSDLHLEISGMPDYKPPEDVDLVILAGDIHMASLGLDWAAETFGQTKTVYVPGNHEYYGGIPFSRGTEILRKHADSYRLAGHPLYVLDNDAVVIDGVRIIGTTL